MHGELALLWIAVQLAAVALRLQITHPYGRIHYLQRHRLIQVVAWHDATPVHVAGVNDLDAARLCADEGKGILVVILLGDKGLGSRYQLHLLPSSLIPDAEPVVCSATERFEGYNVVSIKCHNYLSLYDGNYGFKGLPIANQWGKRFLM